MKYLLLGFGLLILSFIIGFRTGKRHILKRINPKGVLHMDLNSDHLFSLEINGANSVAEIINDGYIMLNVHNDTANFIAKTDASA